MGGSSDPTHGTQSVSYWRKIRTAGMGKRRYCTREEAKEASKRKRRREDKQATRQTIVAS
jgi:hypothetical protein